MTIGLGLRCLLMGHKWRLEGQSGAVALLDGNPVKLPQHETLYLICQRCPKRKTLGPGFYPAQIQGTP